MVDKKVNELGDIGMIGLGVMGRNFALNVADHGFVVVGFDRDTEKTRQLEKERTERHVIDTAGDPKTFCEKLRRPRAIMMLVPALMTALSYWDAYRSGWLPANLVMAQRDYFGSHTYQRIDAQGTFHTQWEV
jgi:6-phosphogluconate dehydrogenase